MRIALRAAVLAALALPAVSSGEARAQGAPADCGAAPGPGSGAGAALTVYPDVPLFTEQFGDERVSGPPLPFRTRVVVLPAPRRADRVLVRTVDGSQCGYVQSSKILAGKPLRVLDIDPSQLIRTTIFGVVGNTWPARAMLRSNPRIDPTAGEVQLFDAPGGEGRPFRRSHIFSLFNVFKVEKRGTDPDDWWYFVGGRKVADDKVLSGWVRGGNLFLSGSSLAVYSTADKSAPFDVYTDVESLKKGAKEGLIATRSELEPPPDRDIAKFPILSQIFQDPKDLMAGRLPIAYEIGFIGRACGTAGDCGQAGKVAPKTGDLPLAFTIDPALKGDIFARMGLTPEEVQRVLSLRQLMTRGYVAYDPQKRNIAFFAAVEPDRFNILQGSLAELCRAMSADDGDLRNRLLGLMLTLAHALGGAPYEPTDTVAEYFDRLIFLPRLPIKTWLDKSANRLGEEWGTATEETKRRMTFSACRSAYLLREMGAGQKVESMDDLELDTARGKVQLKPGRTPRPYTWLWSTESGIEHYFVPVEYLPGDH